MAAKGTDTYKDLVKRKEIKSPQLTIHKRGAASTKRSKAEQSSPGQRRASYLKIDTSITAMACWKLAPLWTSIYMKGGGRVRLHGASAVTRCITRPLASGWNIPSLRAICCFPGLTYLSCCTTNST